MPAPLLLLFTLVVVESDDDDVKVFRLKKKKSKINTKTKCVEQSINNKEMVQIYHEKKKEMVALSLHKMRC